MKTFTWRFIGLVVLGLLVGCGGAKTGRRFVFPEGDVARGKKAFVDMKCYACHTVEGVEGLPATTESANKLVVLGGEVTRLRTYGDLVTSVIHPAYVLSEKYPGRANRPAGDTPMPNFNDRMTVSQMLDIVTFLQPQYRQLEPVSESYRAR